MQIIRKQDKVVQDILDAIEGDDGRKIHEIRLTSLEMSLFQHWLKTSFPYLMNMDVDPPFLFRGVTFSLSDGGQSDGVTK